MSVPDVMRFPPGFPGGTVFVIKSIRDIATIIYMHPVGTRFYGNPFHSLLRYFSLEQCGGPTDWQMDRPASQSPSIPRAILRVLQETFHKM